MAPILRFTRLYLGIFIMGALLAACGSGNTSDGAGSTTGKTAILLTDHKETRIQDHNGNLAATAKEVWVNIRSISLKPEEGDWVTAFSGPPNQSIDLLTLDGTAILLGMADLPAGKYEKARFAIESAHFIDQNNERHDLIIPSERIKIKFDRPLKISGSGDEKLVFDMIPGKSIHLVTTGSGKYLLRPVIKVKLIGEDTSRDMAKVKGQIQSVNCSEERLVLTLEAGNTIKVDMEDALIIPENVKTFSKGDHEDHDEDDDDRDDRVFKAACSQLREGMFVEVIGTFDDDELKASSLQILTEDTVGNRIEFSSQLLEVNCDTKNLKVPFSGGEILVRYNDDTQFEQDSLLIDPADRCDALKAVIGKPIEIEGQIVENQVVASHIILPSTTVLNILVKGTVDLIVLNNQNVITGFILKKTDGSLFAVKIDRRFESHTEIKDEHGEIITADMIALDSDAEVMGALDPTTRPYPSIAATKIEIFPKNLADASNDPA